MKPSRAFLSVLILVVVLFAFALPARAIGFEAEKAYESVFVIYSGNSLGSGFAVGENCIVTNAHVIDDPKSIIAVSYDGIEYESTVLGINKSEDIAILAVDDSTFPYLEIADLTAMKTGDDIYAIGAPKGMAYTLTKGSISAKERMIGTQSYIQIDAAINEGNSGGPLVNDAGQVLGVNTLMMSDSEGIGLAIPINRVCDYLETLGITLNVSGNVIERVRAPEESDSIDTKPSETECQEDGDDKEGEQQNSAITFLIAAIAVLSLVGNVVLVTLLINEKKKCASLMYNPSERTDFDIEILE